MASKKNFQETRIQYGQYEFVYLAGMELVINIYTGESYMTVKGYAKIAQKSISLVYKRLRNHREKGYTDFFVFEARIPTRGGLQRGTLLTETFIAKYLAGDNPEFALMISKLGVRHFVHELAGYEVRSEAMLQEAEIIPERTLEAAAREPEVKSEVEQNREKLELALLPKPEIEQIDLMATIFGRRFGKAYEQRYLVQQVGKHYPQLAGDKPERSEVESLPTAKALLIPTQIAAELHWINRAGNPDARRVNWYLQKLGYQRKIAGRWSATDKAINADLCDRKPVDTNSRTQKDQLLWSADVIDILKEHFVTLIVEAEEPI